jgi:hypothetical protein
VQRLRGEEGWWVRRGGWVGRWMGGERVSGNSRSAAGQHEHRRPTAAAKQGSGAGQPQARCKATH